MTKPVTLAEHMARIRKLVKPANCARTSAQCRAAAQVRWALWRAAKLVSAAR